MDKKSTKKRTVKGDYDPESYVEKFVRRKREEETRKKREERIHKGELENEEV